MSISYGVAVWCDEKEIIGIIDCGEVCYEIERFDFYTAKGIERQVSCVLKKVGWFSGKFKGKPVHFCPACKKSNVCPKCNHFPLKYKSGPEYSDPIVYSCLKCGFERKE